MHRTKGNKTCRHKHNSNTLEKRLLKSKILIQTHNDTCLYLSSRPQVSVGYLTIRPVAREGYGSIAHEAKPHGLLNRGP